MIQKQKIGAFLAAAALMFGAAFAQEVQPAANAASRPVGTVKSIAGNSITLTTDAKSDVTIQVQDTTRFLRLAPDQKDLKQATTITFKEVQVGDRLLASGAASADGKTIAARTIVLMKQADVAQKQQKDVEDWNRRGVGGIVNKVDTAAGTITLASTSTNPAAKPLTIHVTPQTGIRRYAPDSIKFENATKATIDQINAGDQIRALGNRTADGTDLNAEEVVAGSFGHIAGTINSIDAANNKITVTDLSTKKQVTVLITPDSQMHKLPVQMAQRIAFALRGPQGDTPANGTQRPAGPPSGSAPQQFQGRPDGAQGAPAAGGRGPGGGRGGADMSRMLALMPSLTLAELNKGDAVMIVSTQGTSAGVTAITLLSGVEPILTSPNASRAAMLLTPWNLGGGGGGGEEQ